MEEDILEGGPLYDKIWETRKEVGIGAFGVVYKVSVPGFASPRALKLYHYPCDKDIIENEVEKLKKLKHPLVVNYLQKVVRVEKGKKITIGIIMNYMERGDLSKIIFKPKYKYEMYTVIIWMEQLFTVLLHFEKLGIKHCDLKSANILVDAAYYLIIADVGLAKSAKKSKTFNPFAHDIESLGKVCWEIVERREFDPIESMTCDYQWTKEIILKCIEPDEEERWNAERALESIKKQKEVWESLGLYNFAPIENPDEKTIVTPAVFEIKREREKWRLEVEAPIFEGRPGQQLGLVDKTFKSFGIFSG